MQQHKLITYTSGQTAEVSHREYIPVIPEYMHSRELKTYQVHIQKLYKGTGLGLQRVQPMLWDFCSPHECQLESEQASFSASSADASWETAGGGSCSWVPVTQTGHPD